MSSDFWTKHKSNFQIPQEEKEQFRFKDTFYKDSSLANKYKRNYAIYAQKLYIFEDNASSPIGSVKLDFELKFTALRDNNLNQKGQGRLNGFKFEREKYVEYMYSNDEQACYKFREVFRALINQRGFHELFKAHKKIGKGNFASVYLAERIEDDKFFAVKAFSKEASYCQEYGKESLVNEIQIMRQLNSEHIIRLHEVFETENSLYLILDLLNGGQLYDKIKAKHKFTLNETRIIMKCLVDGLNHMHSKRIMHRDLKPENILFRVQDKLEVCIADLGLATESDIDEYMFVRCGTPGFVAPEVVNIKDLKSTYDPVCDIYSLGLIFHILLIGKSPFNGKTYNEVLQLNREAKIDLSGQEYLRIPQEAYTLLKRMLQKDPKQRITAAKAAKDPFFMQLNEQFDISMEEEDKVSDKMKNLNIYQSDPSTPQLLPRKMQQQKLDKDSCVDFKLGRSPVQTGRIEEHKESLSAFESPAMQNSLQNKQIKQMGPGVGLSTPDKINNQLQKKEVRPSIFNKCSEDKKKEDQQVKVNKQLKDMPS